MSASANGKPVLVTGAGGFLGHAVVQRLQRAGREVIPVDITDRHATPGFRQCDITDSASIDSLLRAYRPASVIHLAAFGAGTAGLLASAASDPDQAVRVNLVAFSNLMRASASHGVRRFVWSSSTTVYGPASLYGTNALVDEEALLAPFTVYGATKMIAESMSARMTREGRLEAVAIRLPLVYGPARWYGGTQASWMEFVAAAGTGRGGRFAFDPSPADWSYVTDAADAMIAAADSAGTPGPVYNVVGHVSSTLDMARAVRERTGADGIELAAAEAGVPLALLDGRRIRTELGFEPRITDVDSGIASYLKEHA